jgi:hypothetical protein
MSKLIQDIINNHNKDNNNNNDSNNNLFDMLNFYLLSYSLFIIYLIK